MTRPFKDTRTLDVQRAVIIARNRLHLLDECLEPIDQALDLDAMLKLPGWEADQAVLAKSEAKEIRAKLAHLRWITSNYLYEAECECRDRGVRY